MGMQGNTELCNYIVQSNSECIVSAQPLLLL